VAAKVIKRRSAIFLALPLRAAAATVDAGGPSKMASLD